MFEFIRSHKKWMQLLLVLFIAPSFILVGVSEYGSGGGAGAAEVAIVGGKKITQQEWEEAQRQEIDNARRRAGNDFDPKVLETPAAKQQILENLVAERAIDAELRKSHLTVPDETVIKQVREIDAFKKADGSFDMEQYKTLLAAQGMSPIMFQERMRRDLALQQLSGAIQATAFAPRTVAARLSDISEQEREVQEILFPVAQYLPQVQVTDAMVKAYYDKNASLFQIPEQVKAEYLVFDSSVVEKQVSVTDEEAAEYYAKNKSSFTTKEQRNASHILVAVSPGASAADKAAAKARAAAILAEVQQAPAQFADIARAKSDDKESGANGGDLGALAPGVLPAPVEATISKLKQGEISGLVESEFGYHIVTVTSVKPESVKSFEEAKEQILAEVKKQKMSKKYTELVEQFNNLVYEQSDSLKPAADKLGMEIKTAENLTRTPSPALGDAPFNNAKFLTALFSADSLKNKRNTEAIEVAPTVLIAGRVVEYKPAAKRPLAEVEAVIRQRVAQEEAVRLAKQAGEAKMAAAKAAGDAAGFGEVKVLSRSKAPTIAPAAALAVLKADVSKLPAYVGVDVPGVGYGVYRIGKVSQPAQPNMARRAQDLEEISGAVAQGEIYSYVKALEAKAEAKITAKPAAAADVK
ncbi:SurA N-terminal domain-containing protein [Massilia sp. PAMC28688]|uniref:SurA N-terminal domain-containing protein n=1 Tax=Massilia sp. PAMC28688 TaxID=2861283 RepID=UPI001C6320B1|nr:SurA N-terminal domain-containing protein [Massilia sp. PAMC28688]QYF93173.1 SurA N-terminal domain-containing protein [Massilia sp. PAMC28688]